MNKWLKLAIGFVLSLILLCIAAFFLTGLVIFKELRNEKLELKNSKLVHKLLAEEQAKLKHQQLAPGTEPTLPLKLDAYAKGLTPDQRLVIKRQEWAIELEELPRHANSDLVAGLGRLEVAHSIVALNQKFDPCESICKPVRLPLKADGDIITEYYKIMGREAFNDPLFIQHLLFAKVVETLLPWDVVEHINKVLNPQPVTKDLLDVVKLGWKLKNINWVMLKGEKDRKIKANTEFGKVASQCSNKTISPDEALLLCRASVIKMGVR